MLSRYFMIAAVAGSGICSIQGWAAPVPACQEGIQLIQQVQVSTLAGPGSLCTVLVDPSQGLLQGSMTYRDYGFGNDGSFTVFESVDGAEATSTGMRSYFLFPRKTTPTYSTQGDTLHVISSTGLQFNFSLTTARMEASEGAVFTEDPSVNMTNKGGFELTKIPGIILDTGWGLGNISYIKPAASSVFTDSSGKQCTITNSEIFSYADKQNPVLLFSTDSALADFLAKRCPTLDASTLRLSL